MTLDYNTYRGLKTEYSELNENLFVGFCLIKDGLDVVKILYININLIFISKNENVEFFILIFS